MSEFNLASRISSATTWTLDGIILGEDDSNVPLKSHVETQEYSGFRNYFDESDNESIGLTAPGENSLRPNLRHKHNVNSFDYLENDKPQRQFYDDDDYLENDKPQRQFYDDDDYPFMKSLHFASGLTDSDQNRPKKTWPTPAMAPANDRKASDWNSTKVSRPTLSGSEEISMREIMKVLRPDFRSSLNLPLDDEDEVLEWMHRRQNKLSESDLVLPEGISPAWWCILPEKVLMFIKNDLEVARTRRMFIKSARSDKISSNEPPLTTSTSESHFDSINAAEPQDNFDTCSRPTQKYETLAKKEVQIYDIMKIPSKGQEKAYVAADWFNSEVATCILNSSRGYKVNFFSSNSGFYQGTIMLENAGGPIAYDPNFPGGSILVLCLDGQSLQRYDRKDRKWISSGNFMRVDFSIVVKSFEITNSKHFKDVLFKLHPTRALQKKLPPFVGYSFQSEKEVLPPSCVAGILRTAKDVMLVPGSDNVVILPSSGALHVWNGDPSVSPYQLNYDIPLRKLFSTTVSLVGSVVLIRYDEGRCGSLLVLSTEKTTSSNVIEENQIVNLPEKLSGFNYLQVSENNDVFVGIDLNNESNRLPQAPKKLYRLSLGSAD